PRVKGILVNIFGGIMRCDIIAEGVIAAVKEVGLKVPLVVRLEGTNVEIGKNIIAESGLNVIAADDLDDAAQKIGAAGKEAGGWRCWSTRTRACCARDSPAATARSIPSRRSPTARAWSAVPRPARAARFTSGCRCSTRSRKRAARPNVMRASSTCRRRAH